MRNHLTKFCVNQLQSVEATHQVLVDFFRRPRPTGLAVLKNVSGYELGAHLCLVSSLATSINFVLKKRVFGNDDEETRLKVGDFYRLMLPFHFEGRTKQPKPYDQGWRVITKTGEVYYHSVIAFLGLFNLQGLVLVNFPSVEWLLEQLGKREDFGLLLSVDNKFVLEQTLENKGVVYTESGVKVLINGEYKDFTPGTHVISIFGQEKNKVILADPFSPPHHFKPCVFALPSQTLNFYLRQPTQGIVFSQTELTFSSQYVRPIYIPEQVKRKIDKIRAELKF